MIYKRFYKKSRTCAKIKMRDDELFKVGGLRQSCDVFPWLFNIFVNIIRNIDRIGKEADLCLHKDKWKINVLLFADVIVLVDDSK